MAHLAPLARFALAVEVDAGAGVGTLDAGFGPALAARSFISTRSVMSRFLSAARIGEPWSMLKMNE